MGEEQCLQHQTKTPPNPPNHPQMPHAPPTTTPQFGRGTRRSAQKGASPQERHGTLQIHPGAKANAQDEESIKTDLCDEPASGKEGEPAARKDKRCQPPKDPHTSERAGRSIEGRTGTLTHKVRQGTAHPGCNDVAVATQKLRSRNPFRYGFVKRNIRI